LGDQKIWETQGREGRGEGRGKGGERRGERHCALAWNDAPEERWEEKGEEVMEV